MRSIYTYLFSFRLIDVALISVLCILIILIRPVTLKSQSNDSMNSSSRECIYNATQVPDYMSEPVIDGFINEDIWNYSELDSLLYGGIPDDFESVWSDYTDILVTWRAVWSPQTNKLYVAVTVHDDVKGTFDNSNYEQRHIYWPWRDDSIEFFTDGDRLGGYYYSYNAAQRWRVTGLNERNLGDYPTDGCHPYNGTDFITAVRYESENLWFCEAEFSIYDYLPDGRRILQPGDVIGWDIWYNDSDDSVYNENVGFYEREHQIGWCYKGVAYRDAQYFGDLMLANPFNAAPDSPTLLSPGNGAFLNTAQPGLSWEIPFDPDSDSLWFHLEIATDSLFENHISGSPFISKYDDSEFLPSGIVSQSDDSCQFQHLFSFDDGSYWWRVKASDFFEYGPVSETRKFIIDTNAPSIDYVHLLNPHYGKNWYDRIRESTISLEIQYDEDWPEIASIDAGLLRDPEPETELLAGENLRISFEIDIAMAIDGNYVLTACLKDRAGNTSEDTVLVHIDTTPPQNTRTQSPAISSTPTFTVSWSGGTDGNGVGLADEFDVFVAIDGEWNTWKKRFAGKSDNYNGQFGHSYAFEAVAYDLLGHREDSTGVPESVTEVVFSMIDTIPPIAPIDLMANGANPSRWQISNSFIITWHNPFDPSNLSHSFYKLGTAPESNFDTTGTASTIPPLKIEATQEFGQMLYLWLMDGSGNIDYQNNAAVNVRYDATSPVVEITCPAYQETKKDIVPICASISDITIKEFQLEYRMDWDQQWQFLCKKSLSHSCIDSTLFTWQNSIDSGTVQLKLTAFDKNGLSAADSTVFILANDYLPRPTAKILRPTNQAYVNGWMIILGYATDDDFLKYTLHLHRSEVDSLLVESAIPKQNTELHAFDTQKVPDGHYDLILKAWNKNLIYSVDIVSIIIDNTPPVAYIISPSADTISCSVKIQGVAEDSNLHQMTLHYSPMGVTEQSKFILIDNQFGEWNTIDLNGYYLLHLTVTDQGGLMSSESRAFYVDNRRYEPQLGFTKRCEDALLTIYPNSYPPAIICLEKLNQEDIQYDPEKLGLTDIIYEIYSSSDQAHFYKKSLLTLDFSGLTPGHFNEEKLTIFRQDHDVWQLVGGTPDMELKEISTTIDSLGIYALCENRNVHQRLEDDMELSCQPRVFSPNDPSAENSLTISFFMPTAQEVTIRIFNPSGRIVRNLVENKNIGPGQNVETWDGMDGAGRYCRSGLYIVVIKSGSYMKNQTVMILNNSTLSH